MIQKVRLVKISGILLLTAATFVIALALFLPTLLDLNAYRDDIVAVLQKSLHRKVSFKSGAFAWHFGPSFVLSDCRVSERDGSADFINADKVTIQLALLSLFQKKVEIKRLALDRVSVSLDRRADGTLNIDDLIKPSSGGFDVKLKGMRIQHGTLVWRDRALQKGNLHVTATDISLNVDNIARGKKGRIKLSGDISSEGGSPGRIKVSGSLRLPESGVSLLDGEVNADVDIKNSDAGRFWPYWERHIPFPNPGGRVTVSASFQGSVNEFSSKGSVTVNGTKVQWPSVFHADLAPASFHIDYAMKLNPRLIDVSSVDASVPGFRIKGGVQIHDYRSTDPRIVAKASTPATFRYEEVRSYVPYGIIEKDAADYIENKIKSGIFKLDSGILDGRVSQIAHMEIGQNYNTLMIRGSVEKAVLSYGPKAPLFNTLKGIVELKGKNFNLVGMSGFFGISPFRLDGSISEYNTNFPSDYPVRMEIVPQSPEIAWLAKIAGIPEFEYVQGATLKLSGSGHHSAYRLNGTWDLKNSAYSYPGIVKKPAGMGNPVSFSTVIGRQETRLIGLSYNLQGLSISGTGILGYDGEPRLGFDLQTNSFQLNDTLPILTVWQQYRPRGNLQAHVKGGGNPEDIRTFDYNGSVRLSDVSVQPGDKFKQVNAVSGMILLRGTGAETTGLSARYGASPITVSASVTNLRTGGFDVSLVSPEFFLRDIDLAPQNPATAVRRLNAAFTIHNGVYTFGKVSGLLNDSNFNINGTYSSGAAPSASLTITSSKLNYDDLLLLAPQKKSGSEVKTESVGTNATLSFDVDNFTSGKLQFQKLAAQLQRENGIITLQALTTHLYGGKIAVKGVVSPVSAAGTRYDLSFNANAVDAEKLFTAAGVTRDVTGRISLIGELVGQGNSLSDVKKSASGKMRLHMSNGKLRKFNTLSKVFSILNFSQLLKFQLPDMVSGGMPYNSISGNFSVKGGVVSSEDLFIASDAMNISVIGSADLIKEDLNFTLGVQPLQTVDKIVNRIPIVGWLLTGKDKDLLTAYFEAKGTWADPKVSAIPVKSISKGLMNVFIRVFELPVRLFTDTGEVIMGGQ
ncbi:MAG TPA: AsmA family protein [Desulfuromonadales bacterium]|nr:AsmA family protein [Desulfuromonadales bacterium]